MERIVCERPRNGRARTCWLAVVMVSALAGAATADAQAPWSDETLVLRAGAVVMDVDSNFRVDSRALGKGTKVDAEDDLGLDDSDDVFRAELTWRIASRHQLSAGYFDLSRDETAVTQEDYRIGNAIFPAGVSVATDFDLKVADFSYAYSVIQTERFEIAPLVGVYGLDFDVSVASDTLGLREGESQEFPLPTVGAGMVYRLSPAWQVRANAQYFYVSYDDYEGRMLELGAVVEWNLWRRLSLGAGYSGVDVDIEDKSANGGEGEYEYNGVWAYLAVTL